MAKLKLPPCILCGEKLKHEFDSYEQPMAYCDTDTCWLYGIELPDETWRGLAIKHPPVTVILRALNICNFLARTRHRQVGSWTLERRLEVIERKSREALRTKPRRKGGK